MLSLGANSFMVGDEESSDLIDQMNGNETVFEKKTKTEKKKTQHVRSRGGAQYHLVRRTVGMKWKILDKYRYKLKYKYIMKKYTYINLLHHQFGLWEG